MRLKSCHGHPSPIPLVFLFACQLFSACGQVDLGKDQVDSGKGSEPDFNPLPISAEYVFSKNHHYSTFMGVGWSCVGTVHRSPVREAGSPGMRRFVDRNSFVYTRIQFDPSGTGARDTTRESGSFSDTVAFRESADSLTMTSADAFLNVDVPPGIIPSLPNGLGRASSLIRSATVSFPKRDFPVSGIFSGQDRNRDCGYTDGGQTTPCRELFYSDLYSTSETLFFLRGTGFISLQSGSGGPDQTNDRPQESDSIRLLYRVLDGDTLWYNGSINP